MSLDYLISGFLAGLIVDHWDKKKRKRAMREEARFNAYFTEAEDAYCETEKAPAEEDADYSWREQYRDNWADLNPDDYETLEDFLRLYEPLVEVIYDKFSNLVREQLAQFLEEYDLYVAGAILYVLYEDLGNKNYSACARECLAEILQENGVDMDIVILMAKQEEDGIKACWGDMDVD